MSEAYAAQRDKGIMKARSIEPRAKGFKRFHSMLFALCSMLNIRRPVALTARASDSKSEGWGFKSLLACHISGL